MAWVVDCEYVVEREESDWTVANQGRHFGHFADRRDALRSAVADAARVRRLGHHACVPVRHADGRLRIIPARLLSVRAYDADLAPRTPGPSTCRGRPSGSLARVALCDSRRIAITRH